MTEFLIHTFVPCDGSLSIMMPKSLRGKNVKLLSVETAETADTDEVPDIRWLFGSLHPCDTSDIRDETDREL